MSSKFMSKIKFNYDIVRSRRSCKPSNDADGSCIGHAVNYEPVCYEMMYLPWAVRWHDSNDASTWTLTTNADGSLTLTSQPIVPAAGQIQIEMPSLNYNIASKPCVSDLWGLSGVPNDLATNANILNTLYIVSNIDPMATTWILEPLRVAHYTKGDVIQIEHYRGPYSDNQRRVVQLVSVICPLETWEWRDTQTKELVTACQIFIERMLRPRRCDCRVQNDRCMEQTCSRRKVNIGSESVRSMDHERLQSMTKLRDYLAPRKMLTGYLHKIPNTKLYLRRSLYEANIDLSLKSDIQPTEMTKTLIENARNLNIPPVVPNRPMVQPQVITQRSRRLPLREENGIFDGNYFGN